MSADPQEAEGNGTARLREVLGGEATAWLVKRLRRRLERGEALSGEMFLADATPEQRETLDALLGRRPTRGQSLRVSLDVLDERIRQAGLAPSLAAAVETLEGNVTHFRLQREQEERDWADLFIEARGWLEPQPALRAWLDELQQSGLLKRLSAGRAGAARRLLRAVEAVCGVLPVKGEPLPHLAARALGDSHALDPGTPAATLCVRAAARIGGVAWEGDTAEGRRAAWASVGVLCDELSAPVLVLNLGAAGHGPVAKILRTAAGAGEPIHLSLRMLLRSRLAQENCFRDRRVFICENPAIVALAASRHGAVSAPLVCVLGQPATPALVLLRQLRQAGAILFYHGDFDIGGLRIAQRIFTAVGAMPWRFSAPDYRVAPGHGKLEGEIPETPWDPRLRAAMDERRKVVPEELVAASLLDDLEPANDGRSGHRDTF